MSINITWLERHFYLEDLDYNSFAKLTEICSIFFKSRDKPEIEIQYDGDIVQGITSKLIGSMKTRERRIRKYTTTVRTIEYTGRKALDKIIFINYVPPGSSSHYKVGLTIDYYAIKKIDIYNFEKEMVNILPMLQSRRSNLSKGKPCEILCICIDMRDFAIFCERPEIESPYVCTLLDSFYNLFYNSFYRYPPEITKLAGDGILAIWELEDDDRAFAVKECIDNTIVFFNDYVQILSSEKLSLGSPSFLGCGVSRGIGSKFEYLNDYFGRPIIIARRLCDICPPNHIYVDSAIKLHCYDSLDYTKEKVDLKSIGAYDIAIIKMKEKIVE